MTTTEQLDLRDRAIRSAIVHTREIVGDMDATIDHLTRVVRGHHGSIGDLKLGLEGQYDPTDEITYLEDRIAETSARLAEKTIWRDANVALLEELEALRER